MNIEELRTYCLAHKGATEALPFDNRTLVFSVMGKLFCLTDIEEYDFINVKCNPEEAILLREQYSGVVPGYHMNKKHWNSIRTAEAIPSQLIEKWITDSYNLVVAGMPKKLRDELNEF